MGGACCTGVQGTAVEMFLEPGRTATIPLSWRPDWLEKRINEGDHMLQKEIDCRSWTLSIKQWIFFVRTCVQTETWEEMVKAFGGDEYKINMHHVNDCFVKPWTAGTGASIALLMNRTMNAPQGMFSHSWSGSVVETYNSLMYLVNHKGVHPDTQFFFCTFSMYQPDDTEGITIKDQVEKEAFQNIIIEIANKKSPAGMCVLHTTNEDVYSRLWCVHEADFAVRGGNIPIAAADPLAPAIPVNYAFDVPRWHTRGGAALTAKQGDNVDLDRALERGLTTFRTTVETAKAKCGKPEDVAMIQGKIRAFYNDLDSGHKYLDEMIKKLLVKGKEDAERLLLAHGHKAANPDWELEQPAGDGPKSATWRYQETWDSTMKVVCDEYGVDFKEFYQLNKPVKKPDVTLLPGHLLGMSSYPIIDYGQYPFIPRDRVVDRDGYPSLDYSRYPVAPRAAGA